MRRFTPLGRIRKADIRDVECIIRLLNEPVKKTFRIEAPSDLKSLIYYSVLSICHLDADDKIVGFMSLKDYPLNCSIHPMAWEDYIWSKFRATNLRARNTLFIHMLCWEPVYSRDVVDNMLKSIFMHDPYLNYIAMVKHIPKFPLLVPGQPRAEASFKKMQASVRGVSAEALSALYVAERKEVCPPLRIRRAVEEDNDDIVQILNKHSPKLKELYGEFYVSEIISRHPESDRVLLVCEDDNIAVGVMCLNTQINFESLEDNYELSPFHGFRKYVKKEPGDEGDEYLLGSDESKIESVELQSDTIEDKRPNRISWIGNDGDIIVSVDPDSYSKRQSLANSIMEYFQFMDEEEDDDFDIVNIDSELLRPPMLLSYDQLSFTASIRNLMMCRGHDGKALDTKISFKGERGKRPGSYSFMPIIKATRYSGPSNAFLLEMFAMADGYDERYGFEMLQCAFELFPNRDYCLLSLPTNHVPFPLIDLHFISVCPVPNKMKFVKKFLYTAHVNSVRGRISVRLSDPTDTAKVKTIVNRSPKRQVIMNYYLSSFESETITSYVFLSENLPVGILLIGPLKDGAMVRTLFDLEPDPPRQQTDGAIVAGIINPVFEPHCRWFLREVIRQSEYTTIYWICRFITRDEADPKDNMMSLAGHMVPVRARKYIPHLSEKDYESHKQFITPYSLWVMERPLSSFPRIDVNNSIVVIGASTTGLAFIESLILGNSANYFTMTNITLVTEHGLPTVKECLKAADICVPRRGKYSDRYLKSVPFNFYIDIISGVLDRIDRSNKCINIKGGGTKYYDELIITCGRQFQQPDYMKRFVRSTRYLMDNPEYLPDQPPFFIESPENVILINSLFDSNRALRRLMRMMTDAKEKDPLSSELPVVVYGDNLDSYSCIAGLIDLGITGNKIVFIEPFPPADDADIRVNCFNNQIVDKRVQEILEGLEITIHRASYFNGWIKDSSKRVSNIRIISEHTIKIIPCFAVFFYGTKAIDVNLFRALNECGIVYDGGIIIGPQFETNDPNIYAVGSCTKYSRSLYANRYQHEYYCAEEIGETLAKFFMRKLDPFLIARDKSTLPDILPHYSSENLIFDQARQDCDFRGKQTKQTSWRPVMRFKWPIITWAILPGPMYYYRLRPPGPDIPMEVAAELPKQGHALITDYKGNYFHLQLNASHCVQSITCLSKETFQPGMFSDMYMKHESYYGNLLERYQKNQIVDLYAYFKQSWLTAIHQEKFEDLLNEIRDKQLGTGYDNVKAWFDHRCSLASNIEPVVPFVGFGPKDTQLLGTFLDILKEHINYKADTETVCGQSARLRKEALEFWDTVNGEKIAWAYLAKYLHKYNLTNTNYINEFPSTDNYPLENDTLD